MMVYEVKNVVLNYIKVNNELPTTGYVSGQFSSKRTGRDRIAEALKNNFVKKVSNPLDVRKNILVPVTDDPSQLEKVFEAIDNTKGLSFFRNELKRSALNLEEGLAVA
ncbi:MAG: hypothetical protein GOU97_02605 [Nanoarchaeota archaeon]|nr:hypothetical protein [Nanoarchaeota archaeon]